MKSFKLVRIALGVSIPFFLAGCLATTNLLNERGALPDNLHSIGVDIVVLAQQNCIRISGTSDQPIDQWKKGRKLDTDWIITRFYVSDSDWYKVTGISQGVIDDLFYNGKSKRFICGESSWNQYSDSKSIIFHEYGSQRKSLNPKSTEDNIANSGIIAASTASQKKVEEINKKDWERIKKEDQLVNLSSNNMIELCTIMKNKTVDPAVVRREIIRRGHSGFYCDNLQAGDDRVIAIKWEGFDSLIIGKVILKANQSTANFEISLPQNLGQCTGVSEITRSPTGIWTLACNNGLTATGTFEALGSGRGAVGKGIDSKGKAIEYKIDVR